MFDPVDNFEIPDEWIALAQIPLNKLEEQVSKGLIVVLSNGSVLKRGYTTGTTSVLPLKHPLYRSKRMLDMYVFRHLSGFVHVWMSRYRIGVQL